MFLFITLCASVGFCLLCYDAAQNVRVRLLRGFLDFVRSLKRKTLLNILAHGSCFCCCCGAVCFYAE